MTFYLALVGGVALGLLLGCLIAPKRLSFELDDPPTSVTTSSPSLQDRPVLLDEGDTELFQDGAARPRGAV